MREGEGEEPYTDKRVEARGYSQALPCVLQLGIYSHSLWLRTPRHT